MSRASTMSLCSSDTLHPCQREIFLPFTRRAHRCLYNVALAQTEALYLRLGHIHIVGAGKVVEIGRARSANRTILISRISRTNRSSASRAIPCWTTSTSCPRTVTTALLSEIPFDLMYGGSMFYPYHQNVIWTLLLGLLLVALLEKIREFRPLLRWMASTSCPRTVTTV